MAKLTLLLATFALYLLVANASIYRTTIEIDEDNQSRGGQQSCQQQIQRQQQLRHCQMHLMQEVQGGRGGSSWGGRDNQRQQHLQQCCQQLQDLDNRCRCQGLEQAARRTQQQQGQYGQQGQQQLREIYEAARDIPRRCNIQPREGCDFGSQYLSF